MCVAKFFNVGGMNRVILAAMLSIMAGAELAEAHSVSVGYVSTAANSITIYYGSYHGVTSPEGTVSLIGPVTLTRANSAVVATKPSGLIDGTNNFYASSCNGGSLGTPNAWQSVTFTGVPNGRYSIELTGSFSINWQPCDTSISSGSTQFLLDTSPPRAAHGPSTASVAKLGNPEIALLCGNAKLRVYRIRLNLTDEVVGATHICLQQFAEIARHDQDADSSGI